MTHPPLASSALGRFALDAFFRLAREWALSISEQRALLGVSAPTFEALFNDRGSVPLETVQRIVDLLHIFAAIATLLPQRGRAVAWLRKPNHAPGFKDRPALTVMTTGRAADIHFVRDFLEAQLV